MVFNKAKKQNGGQMMDMSFYAVIGMLLLIAYAFMENR